MPTQRERLIALLVPWGTAPSSFSKLVHDVLDEAQNPPPHGLADGSLSDERLYNMGRKIEKLAKDLGIFVTGALQLSGLPLAERSFVSAPMGQLEPGRDIPPDEPVGMMLGPTGFAHAYIGGSDYFTLCMKLADDVTCAATWATVTCPVCLNKSPRNLNTRIDKMSDAHLMPPPKEAHRPLWMRPWPKTGVKMEGDLQQDLYELRPTTMGLGEIVRSLVAYSSPNMYQCNATDQIVEALAQELDDRWSQVQLRREEDL